MRDFKDESFISQFLSPKVMRDFRFFTVLDDDRHNYLEISAIHNEEGYREIRSKLSSQYNLSNPSRIFRSGMWIYAATDR